MEPHKNVDLGDLEPPNYILGPIEYFKFAHDFTTKNYNNELNHILSTKFEEVDADKFFKEVLWVIHTSGFSAKAVSKFYPKLLKSYTDLSENEIGESLPERISKLDKKKVITEISKIVNNPEKISAVYEVSKKIEKEGWGTFKSQIKPDLSFLQSLPYIGKITKYHLARNIGFLGVVKPDLHLERLASVWGFNDSLQMCNHIKSDFPEIELGIIDLCLWYSASTFGTLKAKKDKT